MNTEIAEHVSRTRRRPIRNIGVGFLTLTSSLLSSHHQDALASCSKSSVILGSSDDNFINRGVPVISNPEIHIVLIGWTDPDKIRQYIQLARNRIEGGYLDKLKVYGIQTATFGGAYIDDETLDSVDKPIIWDDKGPEIMHRLHMPEPASNIIVDFVTPPNFPSPSLENDWLENYCYQMPAFHRTVGNLNYTVTPARDFPISRIAAFTSHEEVEVITDPDPSGGRGGVSNNNTDEIADMCGKLKTEGPYKDVVVQYWVPIVGCTAGEFRGIPSENDPREPLASQGLTLQS